MRRTDATKDSEETARDCNSFQCESNYRERSFSLLIHKSKSKRTWLEAVIFRRIATVEQLQLEQTHSQLYRIPRAATPRVITTVAIARFN